MAHYIADLSTWRNQKQGLVAVLLVSLNNLQQYETNLLRVSCIQPQGLSFVPLCF